MSLWMPVLMCFAVQLCLGAASQEEVIVAQKVTLLGGWFDMDPDSHEVQEAAQHAVNMFNQESNSTNVSKLLSITAAKSQVTNKINYKINAILGETTCLKTETHDLSSCSHIKKWQCKFTVTFDPRNNKHVLRRHKCRNHPKKV